MRKRSFTKAAALLTLGVALGSAPAFAQAGGYDPAGSSTTATVTGATGTIAQLNYGAEGTVNGFLIGTNVLLNFPQNVTGGIAALGAVGNSVTYSGTANTTSAGFESVRVSNFTNNTTKATYTAPTSAATPVTYGPTSGTVKQLNYDSEGNIDGFLFLPSGITTAIVVGTGAGASATLKPLLTLGGTVSVTGESETVNTSACTASGALAVVDATSLTVNGQTIVIAGGRLGGGSGGGPGGPHR